MNSMRAVVKRLFRSLGVDLRSLKHTEEGVLEDVLKRLRPVAVLDVGANVGQYGQLLRQVGYEGIIISFEAQQAAYEKLRECVSGDGNWLLAPCAALGRAPGSAEINISENSVSSSLLAMRDSHVAAAPESRYVDKQIVAVESLDELLPSLLSTSGGIYLKIDTQGYEEEVLLGATKSLERVLAIQLEVSLIPLYEGAPTLVQIFSLMESLGYEPYQIIPGFRDKADGRLLQFDAIFFRKDLQF